MNDLPRQKLRELIAEQGQQLCDDHKSCRTLLRQRCPDHRKEVTLLVDALQEGVADELRTAPAGQSVEPVVTRLVAVLQDDLDLSAGDARGAIRELEQVIKAAPNVAGYRLLLGDAYMGARQYRAAGEVFLSTAQMRAQGTAPVRISASAARHLYWTAAQMVAHHTVGGCDLNPGDLFGTGTISGFGPGEQGCLLEATENGRDPLTLPGGIRRGFLEDGDEVILTAHCRRDGFAPIGFGQCRGVVLPAET